MSAVLKGVGIVWSVGSVRFTGGIVSDDSEHFTQSLTAERVSEKANIKDNSGAVRAQIFHGFTKTFSITVVPVATVASNDIATARLSADAWMPRPGTKVGVTDDSGTIIDDNYNTISARQGRTVDGVETIDLELIAGDEGVELATDPVG